MSPSLLLQLVAVFAIIGVGWVAGKTGVLGPQAASVLGAAAFGLFTPALLFRTTANIPLARLPWATIVAYYAPTVSIRSICDRSMVRGSGSASISRCVVAARVMVSAPATR